MHGLFDERIATIVLGNAEEGGEERREERKRGRRAGGWVYIGVWEAAHETKGQHRHGIEG